MCLQDYGIGLRIRNRQSVVTYAVGPTALVTRNVNRVGLILQLTGGAGGKIIVEALSASSGGFHLITLGQNMRFLVKDDGTFMQDSFTMFAAGAGTVYVNELIADQALISQMVDAIKPGNAIGPPEFGQ